MLLDAALPTLIIGLIAGGRLRRLTDLELRLPALFIAAAVLQAVSLVPWVRRVLAAASVGGLLVILTYLLLLAGLWLNRHLWGARLAAVGVLLNFLVIAANAGSMPVDMDLAERAGNPRMVRLLKSPDYINHRPLTPRTRLKPLADVLPLPVLFPRPRFFTPGSVGDVFITAGACWLILTGLGAFGLAARRDRPQTGEAT